jgi:hypothetical protein
LSRKLHVPTVAERERTLAPINWENGWRQEMVSEGEKRETSLTFTGILTTVFSALSLFAIDSTLYVGGDSSAGIAIRYGLDDPWIESQWMRDLPRRSIPTLGPIQPPVKFVLVLFPAYKSAGASCRSFTPI